jgi:hypothetical protein
MKVLIAGLLLLAGIQFELRGDVVSSTTCSILYSASASGATDCSITGTGEWPAEASATSTGSVALPTSASDPLSMTVSQSVEAHTGTSEWFTVNALATATTSIHVNLYTEGAVRDGYVEVSSPTMWTVAPDGFTGRASLSLGSYNGGCGGGGMDANCYFGNILLWSPTVNYKLPFTLGNDFALDFTQTFNGDANMFSGATEGFGQTVFNFQFFEADGITPVMVFDPPGAASAPEPSTWSLAILPLVGLALWRRLSAFGGLRSTARVIATTSQPRRY